MKGLMPDHGLDLLNKVTVPKLDRTRAQLRRLLVEVELTRGELAMVLGVSRNTLRRWIDGTRNPNRSARRLIQLVERIHFSPEQLGGGAYVGSVLGLMLEEAGRVEMEEREPLSAGAFAQFAQ